MREILFRGRGNTKYNDGAWYYGVPIRDFEDDWQICTDNSKRVVIPETIGQYTGLTDKNGTRIFESDIVNCKTINYFFGNCKVVYRNSLARYCIISADGLAFPMEESFEYEIIGNIFDNPELLRGDANV